MPPPAPSNARAASSRSDQREQTRQRILDAVLAIIVDEGMRAVRHRAVAERAAVSLGSTTYHFSSIEELIISSFDYWRSQRQLVDNPFYREMVGLLQPYGEAGVPPEERKRVACVMLELSVAYLVDQLRSQRQDRIIELAFHHESMRYPALRTLVLQGWEAQQAFLEQVHLKMGSTCPRDDATLTSMLFRQWEQVSVMDDIDNLDVSAIASSFRRHMSLCLGFELPAVTVTGQRD